MSEEILNILRYCLTKTEQEIVINYIENLQEENTSLKKEIKLMKSVNINENYISKDKIRNKIKELRIDYHMYMGGIMELQELLGDE